MRRPRLGYESRQVGLDRNELGALLVVAGLAGACDHALVSLLALNGLRVSEAIGVDIDDLDLQRGHREDPTVAHEGRIACYLRREDKIYLTYWTTARGDEVLNPRSGCST